MNEVDEKFETFSEHLSSIGWAPASVMVSVLSGDDDERPKHYLGKAFFLEVYGYLRSRLCLENGGVKQEVAQGATLLKVCAEAIETITDTNVNASLLMDIVVTLGLDRFCAK